MIDFQATLIRFANGDEAVSDLLLEDLYAELRSIAAHYLKGERADHTLQATALVHEAWLRLTGDNALNQATRDQYLGLAARAMRRVLIDHARARAAQKRGGERQRVSLVEDLASDSTPMDVLDLHEALVRLETQHGRAAQIVQLRFFGGLKTDEAARVAGVSVRTATDDWAFAKMWLRRELASGA